MLAAIPARRHPLGDRPSCPFDPPPAKARPVKFDQAARVVGRQMPHLGDAVFREFRDENRAGSARPIPAHGVAVGQMDFVGEEIPQRIGNWLAIDPFGALQYMRMMPQDDRRPGCDQPVSLLDLRRRGDRKPLVAPVERNDYVADL